MVITLCVPADDASDEKVTADVEVPPLDQASVLKQELLRIPIKK